MNTTKACVSSNLQKHSLELYLLTKFYLFYQHRVTNQKASHPPKAQQINAVKAEGKKINPDYFLCVAMSLFPEILAKISVVKVFLIPSVPHPELAGSSLKPGNFPKCAKTNPRQLS